MSTSSSYLKVTPTMLLLVIWTFFAVASGNSHPEIPIISYDDLMLTGASFSEPGVTSYSQLLFDVSRNQVLVGARDSLFRLGVENLERREKAIWLAPADKVQLCQDKGQSEEDCHNFIQVLLTNGKRLFTCGTNAFSPTCTWREMEEVNRVVEWVRGVGKCPYSPHSNVTSLISDEGQYFAGSPMDFSGADHAIIRDLGPTYLRTNQYNSKWLNEPQFVGSFETDLYVYFVFRESAVEYINCGKIIYSRIARVCKNDNGGQLMLRDNWTTFVKARLNCSLPGEYPFYFDNVQGMSYLPDQGVLYATFTTPVNSIPGSAVCAFNMSGIEAAFAGPYKHQATVGSAWERQGPTRPRHSQCSGATTLLDSTRYQLMDLAVQPVSQEPLYTSTMERLTHIAVDTVSTKIHKAVHVLYVATEEGLVKKISLLSRTQKTCILEVWQPFTAMSISRKIYTLKFASEGIYLGTDEGVLRIAKEHCNRHKSRAACLAAMDPHCGWHDHLEVCSTPPEHNPLVSHWHHEPTRCPSLDHPVDGGWSAWSAWAPCEMSESGDNCLCATRTCDNPAPSRGGAPCTGLSVRVANCTVHGGWTPWSSWSACSQSCGMAVKTRRRSCGNPAPQHGGRVCVGQDRHEMYCHSNPPCPAISGPVRDGGWSSWASWSECTAKCNGGFMVRTRACNNPPPQQPGGLDCIGSHIEYQMCNTASCIESKRLSPWTPWTPAGNGSEKRYRFACRAPTPDPTYIKLTLAKVDDRFCTQEGVCTRSDASDSEDGWSEWSAWSPCSVECGSGEQSRVRTCQGDSRDCKGPSHMSRTCNNQPCRGEWGCWGDWTPCSATCGVGTRTRSRDCLGVGTCEGESYIVEPCHVNSCFELEGWDEWGTWSECDDAGTQKRKRICLDQGICQGSDVHSRLCDEPVANEVQEGSVGAGTVVGCVILGFIVGAIAALAGYYLHGKRSRHRVPGSPHYISSKQNPYVTVPLKEVSSPKRAPSFSKQSNGATPKLFSKPLQDYETATIKRNSHSLTNGHVRADLDQDKFF
ncbi:semaphorin 5c [Halyomorpha halys]|uniref:semaphorin 5c n=1 Tax=Halyomorpha halys TaxID=286706 RepID=UPI0006D4D743